MLRGNWPARHDLSCWLGRKTSTQTNKQIYVSNQDNVLWSRWQIAISCLWIICPWQKSCPSHNLLTFVPQMIFCKSLKMTNNHLRMISLSNWTEITDRDGPLLLYFNRELPEPFSREKIPHASIIVSRTWKLRFTSNSISRSGTGLGFFMQTGNTLIRRTNGWMDKHDVYWTVTFNRSCNVLKVNPSGKKKQHTVPNICQKRRPYWTQTLFQFSASLSPFLGPMENATFAHFIKKSMHLKTAFLLDYQVLFLLLNGPQIEKKIVV